MLDGTYTILYVKFEGSFLPIACLTSDSFSESTDMIDAMNMNSASYATSRPTNQGYNISFDGLIKNTFWIGADTTKVSLDRLRRLKRARTLIEWKTQDNNLTFIDSGFGYITSLSKNSNIDEFISFSGNIEGFGTPYSSSSLSFNLQNELQFTL
tara:strand:- start:84 stop:545 length:462 start_codon:yes stop_codon:yes gene_type:complete